ncbi:SGNH/GDSL hydrolase family protein [Streptomyces sp. NPDC058964]|uniref:SGNH/GDSL hydrolase family protein n=1 Tax=Streptomyces sp. NPDC058964 TaxID=3346681 RepID=UPI00367F19C0
MTTRPRAVLAGLLLTAIALATAVGTAHDDGDGSARGTAPSASRGLYVAMGDSYTSGPEIPVQTGEPAGCGRSDHNYPTLVAARLGVKAGDFHDVSCSGATIPDLTAPQSTEDGTNPAQVSALSSRTRLVTIGIGGNDVDFIDMVARCIDMGTAFDAFGSGKHGFEDAPCRGSYVEDGTDSTRRRIAATGERLSGALSEVRRRAPAARVYVVGYPAVLPPGNDGCGLELPLAPGDITYLRETEQELNSALRERARAGGATYVDTYGPSREHSACSPERTRWIEPLRPSSLAAAVHPNARGERGMADAVLRAVKASR